MRSGKEIRRVILTKEFEVHYNTLTLKVREKYDYVLKIITDTYIINSKFIKKIEKTILYEMRISVGNNEYRTLLFAIDNKDINQSRNIILLNSFLKKDTKQYRREIERGLTILKKYII